MQRLRNGATEVEGLLVLGGLGVIAWLLYKGLTSEAVQKAIKETGEAASGAFTMPGSLNLSHTSYEIPGTGQTVSDLVALGYSQDEIAQLMANASQQYGSPLTVAPAMTEVDPSPWAGVASALGF